MGTASTVPDFSVPVRTGPGGPTCTMTISPTPQNIQTRRPPLASAFTRGKAKPPTFARNVPQQGDALTLLKTLPDASVALTWFDPQHRSTLERLKYGNEGARQVERCALPQMSDDYINTCIVEIARVLQPSGHLMIWEDTYRLLEGFHLRTADLLKPIDLLSWTNGQFGMGYRLRRGGSYLVISQKFPIKAKSVWTDHSILDRWVEKIDRKANSHPHAKPVDLITKLIAATTRPGDLIIDPCAGSFVVLDAVTAVGERSFIGCDITHTNGGAP